MNNVVEYEIELAVGETVTQVEQIVRQYSQNGWKLHTVYLVGTNQWSSHWLYFQRHIIRVRPDDWLMRK